MAIPIPPPEVDEGAPDCFLPSKELQHWAHETFIDGTGPLVNPDHEHLKFAYIGYLWTNVTNGRHMQTIVGTAEMPMKKGGWLGAREQYQLQKWFGTIPQFLITLYAPYFAEIDELSRCAVIEHELYHCAQKRDPATGGPKFTKDGFPVFGLRGHDVEEHVGIMRRYGISGCAGASREFVEAAMKLPEIGHAEIEFACGNCYR